MALRIDIGDPHSDDVRQLLAAHLLFARTTTPPEFSFALSIDQLCDPAVTFFCAREDGHLHGIAALKPLNDEHTELKSMHTAEASRRRGVARALLEHVIAHARDRGCSGMYLETGTVPAYLPARTLYTSMGFKPCPPFGEYRSSPYNTFRSLRLR